MERSIKSCVSIIPILKKKLFNEKKKKQQQNRVVLSVLCTGMNRWFSVAVASYPEEEQEENEVLWESAHWRKIDV